MSNVIKSNHSALHRVVVESISTLGTGFVYSGMTSERVQNLFGELIGLVYRLLCMASTDEIQKIRKLYSWNDLETYMSSYCSSMNDHAARRLWSTAVFPILSSQGCHDMDFHKVVENIVRLVQNESICPQELGWIYEDLLSYQATVQSGIFSLQRIEQSHQKRTGAHYTPKKLVECVIQQTLIPVLENGESENLLSIRVCDPSCGSGLFLLEAASVIASKSRQVHAGIIRDVICSCIYGVDINRVSVDVCILSLWLTSGLSAQALGALERNIRQGNSVLDQDRIQDSPKGMSVFSWKRSFPAVFARENPGFDCMLGNPPWISFSGRHAHPISKQEKELYQSLYSGFFGWLALHSLFVEQGLRQTREHGFLGFVLPRQLSDLSRYAAIRNVVRQNALVQEPLTDFGGQAFAGVEQPSFGLVVQKQSNSKAGTAPFVLDCSNRYRNIIRAFMSRLSACEKPSKESFRDIGVHTGNCAKKLISKEEFDGYVPVYEGKNIHPFRLEQARIWLNIQYTKQEGEYYTLRSREEYERVQVVIRQTAHRPIAAKHIPRGYFRNSILACYEIKQWSDDEVVSWLNSTILAFFHLNSIPESRQLVFPQMKIGHLRNLPIPSGLISLECDTTLDEEKRRSWMDQQVSHAFGFSAAEHRLLCALYDFQCVQKRRDALLAKKSRSHLGQIQYEELVASIDELQNTIERLVPKMENTYEGL